MKTLLSHVRVLDLTRLYPGAFCTQLLVDLGADVLKVEAPRFGDGMRMTYGGGSVAPGHVALNRGKRSLALDLKKPGAAAVLRRLARDVDVVVEAHRPGALDAMGIGYEALRRDNPRLVWCTLTSFGQDGPLAEAAGHDLTFLGYSGLLSRLAGSGPLPVPDTTVAVPLAGALGAVGILAALAARDRTGEGARVDTCMAEAALWLVAEDVTRSAVAPGKGWGAMAARQHYRCADDRWVTVAATEPKPWGALCTALGLADLAEHRHGVDEPATIARLAAAFATQPAAHWVQTPGLAGGVAPVNEPGDLRSDPHQAARYGIVDLHGGGATAPVVANPIRVDGADGRGSSAGLRWPPDLGADTDAALAAAGFSADEIAALHADGVV
jgi:crotonobetainyl-CoA:carnitine CoA-transferase CaiB-like acyl-CoA transferase